MRLNKFSSISILKSTPEAIRREDFQGQEHLVIPIIALVEGIMTAANSDTAAFVSAEEFLSPLEGWNGRPVVVNHPKRNGDFVSANSPEVFENEVIGFTFNAVAIDGDKKLRVEAWINLQRVEELGGIVKETIDLILAGEEIEISTGYFAEEIATEGFFDGKKFDVIQEHIVPDHLAILDSEKTGACSWEDGCGAARMNQGDNKMPKSEPCPSCSAVINGKDKLGWYKSAIESFSRLLSFKNELSDMDRKQAITSALAAKGESYFYIVAVFDGTVVYEKDFTILVQRTYSIEENNSITLGNEEVLVRPVTSFIPVQVNQEDKKILHDIVFCLDEVKKDAIHNSPTHSEGYIMSKEELVSNIIAHVKSSFGEADMEWLTALTEDNLSTINESLGVNAKHDPEEDEDEEADKKKKNSKDSKDKNKDQKQNQQSDSNEPISVDEFIQKAPPAMQDFLTDSVRMHEEKKMSLIKTLTANPLCVFTESELSDMVLQNLEKLQTLADKPDYSGQAGAGSASKKEDPNAIPPAPLVFDFSKRKEARK